MGQFADDVRGFGASCQQRLTVTGDPEAAIRTPIEHLLEAAATMLGKALVPHSESRLDELQVRPDFAMRVDGAICGYVEVKRPGAALDPDGFTGHNRRQWERLRELPNLLYTNGTHWRLYRDGELLGEPADLQGDLRTAGASLDGDVAGLERLLRALQLLTDQVSETFRVSLDLLARVVGAVDWTAIRSRRADAYLHLYEHFLEEYDDDLRKASGSYYTPREVVDEMVRLVGDVLRDRLGHDEEFLSDAVTTVDPAMGTGTFLHAILTRAGEQAVLSDGPGAAGSVVAGLAARLIGFELQMGPFAVAELRASDLLHSFDAPVPSGGLPLFVTNTLDDPEVEQTQLGTTYAAIAQSRRRADRSKARTPVTVVIGNPPYRERAEGQGGLPITTVTGVRDLIRSA